MPPSWTSKNIIVLEMFPIVPSIKIWGSQLANKCITFHTDNQALSEVINKKTTKDRELLVLLRALVLSCLQNNILFKAVHLPGVHNTKADALSRLQVTKFKSLSKDMAPCASPTVTRELAVITKTLLEASLSNASVSVYKRPWKLFTDWSASYLGDMPINLPLQPVILAPFIAHLYSRSYSSS